MIFFQRLGTVFDCIVVVLKLIIAVRKIDTNDHLDLFDEFDSLLLCRNDRILVHLEQHLQGDERLVVVLHTLLILLLLHAKVAVKALDVRHEEFVFGSAHRVVFNNYALLWCAQSLLIIGRLALGCTRVNLIRFNALVLVLIIFCL